MEHQWFCGGLDPCVCMDSWKEAESEKRAKKDKAQAEWDKAQARMMHEIHCTRDRMQAVRDTRPMYVAEQQDYTAAPLPACVHEWAFLRTRTTNIPMMTVDVFFCRRCLEYRTKEG